MARGKVREKVLYKRNPNSSDRRLTRTPSESEIFHFLSTTMSSTAKRTSSSSSVNQSKENPVSLPNVVNRPNPLGDITNQKSGDLVNFFSSFPPRKLVLGFIAEPMICKLLQLLNVHCSKKITQSKPPKPIAKPNLLLEEDIESSQGSSFFDAVSDLGDDGDIDSNLVEDPQLCGAFACDIYEHLRLSEAKKRPAVDYMERVQPNINATMRTILIDWLVEVAEEFSLSPETLYLAVNCLDRYLSGNVITKANLQLLGVSCLMISEKYYDGGVRVPRRVESFVYMTDDTYSRNELLEMESSVLSYLKFELTTPTAECFLSRFVRAAAQGEREDVIPLPSLLFESLASYLCELSLLGYAMLRYAPSLVAASAVFLARCILHPLGKPWSSTLERYTRYRGKDLEACVKNLLQLCHESPSAHCVAVREKYSKDKYECAAKQFYPTSLPQELFF
ncbi:hypothetical protein Bca4012_084846 [Brassica carinata]